MAQGKLSQVQTNDAAAFLPSSAESTRAAAGEQGLRRHADPTRARRRCSPQTAATSRPSSWRPCRRGPPACPTRRCRPATTAPGPTTSSASRPSSRPRTVRRSWSRSRSTPTRPTSCWPTTRASPTRSSLALRASLDESLGATATSAGELGLQAWVTGPAGFVADLVTAFGGIDGVLLLVALGAVLLILVLVYRSPFLPFVVIFTAVFALCLAGLVVYHLAKNGTLRAQRAGAGDPLDPRGRRVRGLRAAARGALPGGAAAASSIPATAMRRALRACVEPIAASAGTVIAGVLCLLLSDLGSEPVARPGRGDRHRVGAARGADPAAGRSCSSAVVARASCSGPARPARRRP